jgi:hypothetical protein
MLTAHDANVAMQTLSGKQSLGRPLKVRPCDQKRTHDGGQHSNRLASDRWKSTPQERSVLRDEPCTGSTAADLLVPIRENRRVYVGGLAKPLNNYASDVEIRSLSGGFEVEAVSKVKWPELDAIRGNG